MRSKYISQVVTVALIGTLGLTGCKNFHFPWTKKTPPPTTLGGGTDIPIGVNPPMDPATLEAGRKQFAAQVVYFDYDSAKVKPSEMSKLDAVASALKGG